MGKLSDSDNDVRQAAANAIGEIAKAKPELMNESFRDALVGKLSDSDNDVRQAAANALTYFVINQKYDTTVIKNMTDFVQDQENGFGLPQQKINEGINLLYAFANVNDPEALDLFLTRIKELNQQQKEDLVNIGHSYFKANSFKNFVEILTSHRRDNYISLVRFYQEDFLKVIGLNREIEGRVMDGWDGIARLTRSAGRYGFLREVIINKIIVTLRLLRQGAGRDTGFRQAANIEGRFPELKNNLTRLLEIQDIPLYVKRRLLQSFPLGDREDIELLRERAIRLVNAVTGLGDSREGLVGNIRNRIHNNPSSQDLPVVEAYKLFVETSGRRGADQLEKFGLNVSTGDRVAASRKEQALQACDVLLTSLKQVYGGGSLENIRESIGELSGVLDERQRRILDTIAAVGKIDFLLKVTHYNLEDLKEVVDIRQRVNDLIKSAQGEALYQALKLDLRLEILVYRVLNSMDGATRDSPEILLLMLQNTRLNGYGTSALDRLIDELGGIVREENSRNKDMKLYAVIQRAERMMKDSLGEAVSEYQTRAEQTGRALDVSAQDEIWVENFSSNIFRGDSLYLLSLLMTRLKKRIKNELGLNGWQVVVEGTMSGKLHYVKSFDQLKNVKSDEILVVDRLPSDSPVLSKVAGIIVFEEDSLLSHPAIRARQNGIPYVVCPDKDLIEKYYGQKVTIIVQGDNVDIKEGFTKAKKLSVAVESKIQVPSANLNSDIFVLPENYSPRTTGQKGYNLQEMDQIPLIEGQRQARHLSLSFAYYQHVLQDPSNNLQKAGINAIVNRLELGTIPENNISESLSQLRSQFESLHIPVNLLEQTRAFIRRQIPTGLVFLRSSTNAEDLPGYAGAGLYDSFGAIDPDNLEQLEAYIKKVWASVWNERAYADRDRNRIDHFGVHMSVLVQEMVNSTYSYVIHTDNPSNKDEMLIEIVEGLGEALVSGSAEYQGAPHRFVYNKINGQIRRVGYADKDWRLVVKDGRLQRELTDYRSDIFANGDVSDILRNLFKQAKGIEQLFSSKPQDIEGCIVKQETGQLETVFVQSRDQQGVGDRAMLVSPVQSIFRQTRVGATIPSQKPDKTGGIDLTPANLNLQTQNSNGEIKFHIDPAMLAQLQNAPGFVPVIINIQPLKNLQQFLNNDATTAA